MNRYWGLNRDRKLLNAYRTLFSHIKDISIDNVNQLNLSKIKTAYRTRALETHPDRSKVLGINKNALTLKFEEINSAYSSLQEHIKLRNNFTVNIPKKSYSSKSEKKQYKSSYHRKAYAGKWTKKEKENFDFRKKSNSEKTETGNTGKSQTDSKQNRRKSTKSRYNNSIPRNVNIPFGQYLLFSGCISFKSLLDALFWQREQRDRYGKIANDWGIFEKDDVVTILRGRLPLEKFGECALRLGYISTFQHKTILFKQRRVQSFLGEYFVNKGIIDPFDLESMLKIHQKYYKKP